MNAPTPMPGSATASSPGVVQVSVTGARRPAPGLGVQLLQLLGIGLLTLATYGLISHFFVGSVKVVGSSMVPTLHNADRYLLNRWVFCLRCPRRAEIVVLRDPLDQGFAVKRVIGAAGDCVRLKGGEVYLNGHKLEEAYLPRGTQTFPAVHDREQTFRCGPDQFFVLGDNRGNSIDSRVYGPVPRRNIVGLVIY